MNKETYTELDLEIICFDSEDVIVTSCPELKPVDPTGEWDTGIVT